MWPFAPRPARESPRAAAWAPPMPAASVPAPRASPAAPSAEIARKRPVGFTLLSLLFAVVAPALAVMLLMAERPPGLPGAAFRLLDVSVLASAAVLSIGLWRCERWVGKVAAAWAALLAVSTVLERIYVVTHVRSPAITVILVGMTVVSAIPVGAVVWYVRRRNRDLWPTP